MDIVVLGATGHVGREVAGALPRRGHRAIAVTRDRAHAADLQGPGVRVEEADVHDVPRLARVLATGRRAFLLNPPADPAGDTDREERRTVEAIVAALDGSGLERVVAQSVWGPRPGTGYGDLSVLHHFEELLAAQPIPTAIMRVSYLMTNWDALLKAALESGRLTTMLPEDLPLPMVSPRDLGRVATDLLLAEGLPEAPVHVEGPERYTPRDVAEALGRACGRRIACEVVPRADWVRTFEGMGFSEAAARSYAQMTGATADGEVEIPRDTVKGKVSLAEHVSALIA